MNTTTTTHPAPPVPPNSAQYEFNKRYIGVAEIAEYVGVVRVSVYKAAESGRLPNTITNCAGTKVLLWERAAIAPFLEAWRDQLAQKRNTL